MIFTPPHRARPSALLAALALAACAATPDAPSSAPRAEPQATVYVLRRGWHTELGIPVEELRAPLSALRGDFSEVSWLVFGFADRQYVLATHRNLLHMLLAPLPGPGLMLVSGLKTEPAVAYGSASTIALSLTAQQDAALQAFVWASFQGEAGKPPPVLHGRYTDNQFYASSRTYHAFYTCNTWTAEALQRAGLPVRAAGELFADQLWAQVQALGRPQP